MNKLEFDALPGTGSNCPDAERLFALARQYRAMEDRAYKSFSGSDVAEAPAYGLTADAFGCIAQGKDVEATLALMDAKWRAYAVPQQAKVAAAPKTMSGHSVISHHWVSEELFAQRALHIRAMCRPQEAVTAPRNTPSL